MTIEELTDKIDELLNADDGLINYLNRECLRLAKCGGIDLPSYEPNFAAAKIILTVALENAAWQYRPLAKEFAKVAKNLKHF